MIWVYLMLFTDFQRVMTEHSDLSQGNPCTFTIMQQRHIFTSFDSCCSAVDPMWSSGWVHLYVFDSLVVGPRLSLFGNQQIFMFGSDWDIICLVFCCSRLLEHSWLVRTQRLDCNLRHASREKGTAVDIDHSSWPKFIPCWAFLACAGSQVILTFVESNVRSTLR